MVSPIPLKKIQLAICITNNSVSVCVCVFMCVYYIYNIYMSQYSLGDNSVLRVIMEIITSKEPVS